MLAIANFDFVRTGTPPEREEMFTMQERVAGPVRIGTERPAADIFAERAAEAVFGVPSPSFIP